MIYTDGEPTIVSKGVLSNVCSCVYDNGAEVCKCSYSPEEGYGNFEDDD